MKDHKEKKVRRHRTPDISGSNKKKLHSALMLTAILVITVLFFMRAHLTSRSVTATGDNAAYWVAVYGFIRDSFFHYHSLYFWIPNLIGGTPFFADAQVPFMNINHLLVLLAPTLSLGVNLSIIACFIIAGIGMFFLARELIKNDEAAFVSALIFFLNGWIAAFMFSHPVTDGYALMPWIFLFAYRAVNSKRWLGYAIIAGVFIAMQAFSGAILMILYTAILLGLYFIFNALLPFISRGDPARVITRLVLVALVVFGVGAGLSAVKLLPSFEYQKLTNRAQGLAYDEYAQKGRFSDPLSLGKVVTALVVRVVETGEDGPVIGLIPSVLLCFALPRFRRKNVLFFLLAISFVLLFLIVPGLPRFFYNCIPVFNKTRRIDRLLSIVIFSACLLAGYGYLHLRSLLKKKHIMVGAALLIMVSLSIMTEGYLRFNSYFTSSFYGYEASLKEQNKLMLYLKNQSNKELFRVTSLDADNPWAASLKPYTVPLRLQQMEGFHSGLWLPEYVSFQMVSYDPRANARLKGILNVKYITSSKEVNITGFNLVKVFPECEECYPSTTDGPYLYENLENLPRAYIAEHAVLLAGDYQATRQAVYALLLHPGFEPRSTVVLYSDASLSGFDISSLKSIDGVVLLSGGSDPGVANLLSAYHDAGGIIVPDVFSQMNISVDEQLSGLLSSLRGSLNEAEVTSYQPNRVSVKLRGEEGFLVLSEKFYIPGWSASFEGREKEIFQADAVISAVPLYGEAGELVFSYNPPGYNKGLVISIVTLIAVVVGLVWWRR
ncbi:TPA: YfhO family protein [Candidatus Woesearchaeota archaeon]|nr:YfhO family protein [Candidatus Woesearchaeota archaeon]